MEFINKVEIQGYINSPTFTDIQGKKVARFALATEYAYKVGSMSVVDTTWFSCIAFENEGIDFSVLQAGNTVNVTGRLKERRYVNKEGTEVRVFEVICKTVKLVE